MALQIEGNAVLLTRVPDGGETLDQQLEADLAHVRNCIPRDARGQGRKQEEMTPAMGRRADESGQSDLAILQLAEIMRQAHAAEQALLGLLVDELADVVGNVVGIGAR